MLGRHLDILVMLEIKQVTGKMKSFILFVSLILPFPRDPDINFWAVIDDDGISDDHLVSYCQCFREIPLTYNE